MEFKIIQEHFNTLNCPKCMKNFSNESVNLVRKEKDYWVIKVNCLECFKPVGIAIVGIESFRDFDSELTSSELEKFSELPPISTNDVLDAHEFIKGLDDNWSKYIRERNFDDFDTFTKFDDIN